MAKTLEDRREYERQYRKNNPEIIKATKARYRKKNAEKINADNKAWRLANPEAWKKSQAKARRDRNKKINTNFDRFVNHKITNQRANAKSRGYAWNLTKTQVYELFSKNKFCALTGIKLTYKIGSAHQASLDRIDNRYGYSIKNVQVVSATANKSRMTLTIKEWDKLCISRAKQLGYHK